MFGDARHRSGAAAPNQPHSIRAGIGVWRAPMRRRGANREKFFCCQNRDSESVRHASERTFEHSRVSIMQSSSILRITKNTTTQQVFCNFSKFGSVSVSVLLRQRARV